MNYTVEFIDDDGEGIAHTKTLEGAIMVATMKDVKWYIIRDILGITLKTSWSN